MRTVISLLPLAALATPALADPPGRTFSVLDTLPGAQYTFDPCIAVRPGGDTFAAATFLTAPGPHWAIFRHARTGATRWARTDLPTPQMFGASTLIATSPSGALFLAGLTWTTGQPDRWHALRLNPDDGTTLWARTIPAVSSAGRPTQLVATANRLHIVGVADGGWSAAALDAATGEVLWTASEPAADRHCGRVSAATSAADDGAGGLYVGGIIQVDHTSDCDEVFASAVARYDAAGNRLWLSFLPLPATTDLFATTLIRVGPDGRPFASAGQTPEASTFLLDPADGSPLWADHWAPSFASILRATAITPGGDLILAADVRDEEGGPDFITTRKLDHNSGQALWTSTHHAPGESQTESFALAIDPAGDAYVAAWRSIAQQSQALAIALRGSDGLELWTDSAPPPPRAASYNAVAADSAGSPVFAGIAGPAILLTREGCPADFTGDGFLDFFDYDAFVACFEGDACPPGRDADFNGDNFADFFDYDAFITAFEAGC